MCTKTEKQLSFIEYIERKGFCIDVDRYEALSGRCITKDELIDEVYETSMSLIVESRMSVRQACEYLYEIGKLNKK